MGAKLIEENAISKREEKEENCCCQSPPSCVYLCAEIIVDKGFSDFNLPVLDAAYWDKHLLSF